MKASKVAKKIDGNLPEWVTNLGKPIGVYKMQQNAHLSICLSVFMTVCLSISSIYLGIYPCMCIHNI